MSECPGVFLSATEGLQQKRHSDQHATQMKEAANWERPHQLALRSCAWRKVWSRATYCSALATLLNVPFTAVQVACTATMIATEILAAMRPYSMAVAPVLSLKKRITSLQRFKRLFKILFKCSAHGIISDFWNLILQSAPLQLLCRISTK